MTPADIVDILDRPFKLQWRAHGIGFIKAYLDDAKTRRINVYHKMFLTPNISLHHDHPWELRSTIYAGELTNVRYDYVSPGDENTGELYTMGTLCCHPFDGIGQVVHDVVLRARGEEVYAPYSRYRQLPNEVHATTAIDGTVTVLERGPPSADNTARIFWPEGTEWVDATRELGPGEIVSAAEAAMRQMGVY